MKQAAFIIFFISMTITMNANLAFNKHTQELNSVQKKIEKNNQKLSPKQKQRKKIKYKIGKLNKEIKYNQLKLIHSKKKYSKAIQSEKKLSSDLDQTKKETTKLENSFKKRIQSIYKQSHSDIVEFLFSSKSITFNSTSIYYFSKIIQKDISLLKQLSNKKNELNNKKETLKKERLSIKKYKEQIESKEKKLSYQKKQQSSYLSSVEKEIKLLIKQNKELENISYELSDLIAKAARSANFYGTGTFIKPVKGWISSRYGMRLHPIFKRKIKHTGIDIAAPKGQRIKATDSGKVIFSGTKGGYGKSVLIFHGIHPKTGKSLSSFYAHQSRILVKKGDMVKKGEEIGWVGATGYATGPHLHFEIKENGKHVDPLKYISNK